MRSFWPRSTLGRTLLLLAVLLLGTQGAVYVLFHQYVLNPAAERFAEFLWQTDHALIAAGADHSAIGTLQWRSPQVMPGTPANNYFLRQSARYLARIAPGAALRVGPADAHTTWMWIRGDYHQPWLGLRVSPMEFGGRGFMFIRLGIIALCTLLGAWIIVRQINRPLARLAAEAPRIGRGDMPESLAPIGGPLEVRHLEQAITSMAKDLHRLHEERTLLLTGISHELRTPLSRLLLTLHLQDPDLLAGKAAMLVDVSEMDETIDKFLTLVRSGDEEKVIRVEVTDWVMEMAETGRERYGLEVQVEHAAEATALPPLRCRPFALERVFRNLFDNARRYGGGRLDVQIIRHPDSTEIRLRDHGPGVPERDIEAMNSGTLPRQSGHGSGIGLRICRRIMALHGGTLRFANARTGGLIAKLAFPDHGTVAPGLATSSF
ncbi:MAG: ATP-binding protein [Gammaproteobacteria bacterium]|jgi:two-component system osmolarity sensor histidine kinase EnvZ|uniref:ATP-binding protein n=1 Tax=Acidithiobacillus ferrooxidans TaxID=920 RepID=UPI001CDB91E9|nr:ATP-binding protein [Acidithiobacillus ferrooxidans]MCL4526868.1 ATP-binding protein [Gammaproteobacteria bacterium]MCL5956034.1 ATP-binding protein [Gammaproteobacteria bacterium]MCR1344657.1 ATP-binding protein [Acidithiobacillus ferrooxidans]MCR1356562.1 ATP-binding protein [Acidithiobacillus ferrooxidans]UBU62511.1 HAMP domain-containing protein [Acidithiobacillus ferrooxidans]